MIEIKEVEKDDMFEIKQRWWKKFNDMTGYHISKSSHFFKISTGDEKIGYIEIDVVRTVANISELIIYEKYRGKGYGHRAMEFAEKFAKNKKCHKIRIKTCKEIMPIAYNLYLKHGFQVEAKLKNDYFNKDWVILSKYI